jgi:Asp/Glu/hydantoin racemase
VTRIAFLHTGAVVIPPVMALAGELLPGATPVNYLDDKIVADLRDPERSGSVEGMLTCSSISQLAAPLSEKVGVPVLRIDEAMADIAVQSGARIAVIATLPTTCEPTTALIRERADLAGKDPQIASEVVDGAFEAVAAGDRETHDRLVVSAIERLAAEVDVIVLAQASMASAAEAASVDVPVLTSLRPGVERLRDILAS